MYYGAYSDIQNATASIYKRELSSAASAQNKRKDKLLGDSLNNINSTISVFKPLNPKIEKSLVKEAELEFKRRGKFKRVFPSVDYHYYKQFFTEERQFNLVLDQRIMSKRRLANNGQIIIKPN